MGLPQLACKTQQLSHPILFLSQSLLAEALEANRGPCPSGTTNGSCCFQEQVSGAGVRCSTAWKAHNPIGAWVQVVALLQVTQPHQCLGSSPTCAYRTLWAAAGGISGTWVSTIYMGDLE